MKTPREQKVFMNPLRLLNQHGQSVWLDNISRGLITSGNVQRLIDEDGVSGMTSNPTIFDKAIAGSTDYDAALHRALETGRNLDGRAIAKGWSWKTSNWPLMCSGRSTTAATAQTDSSASKSRQASHTILGQLSPRLDTFGRAWRGPNIMIKVPATVEGTRAVELLTAESINVNITLMFSLEHYEAVAHAYLRGLGRHPAPHRVISVASLFVSRIDVAADRVLETSGSPKLALYAAEWPSRMHSASTAAFATFSAANRFATLWRRGARVQRPLCASTGTKNPSYSDFLYLEALIGPETITTFRPQRWMLFAITDACGSHSERVRRKRKPSLRTRRP
jgi:transaldolase